MSCFIPPRPHPDPQVGALNPRTGEPRPRGSQTPGLAPSHNEVALLGLGCFPALAQGLIQAHFEAFSAFPAFPERPLGAGLAGTPYSEGWMLQHRGTWPAQNRAGAERARLKFGA